MLRKLTGELDLLKQRMQCIEDLIRTPPPISGEVMTQQDEQYETEKSVDNGRKRRRNSQDLLTRLDGGVDRRSLRRKPTSGDSIYFTEEELRTWRQWNGP